MVKVGEMQFSAMRGKSMVIGEPIDCDKHSTYVYMRSLGEIRIEAAEVKFQPLTSKITRDPEITPFMHIIQLSSWAGDVIEDILDDWVKERVSLEEISYWENGNSFERAELLKELYGRDALEAKRSELTPHLDGNKHD